MPSYLKELVKAVDDKILMEIQNEYGEYSTAFKFNIKFKKIIRTWLNEYNEYGLTVWGINSKDEKIMFFDPTENGYNGLMELNGEENLTIIKTIDFDKEIEIIIVFQYSGEENEYAEEGKSKYEEDYFDWIIIYTYDGNDLKEIINIECA
jgi:hypothetical protein